MTPEAPEPTLTTARLVEEKGEGSADPVEELVGEFDGVDVLDGVAEHDPSKTGATEYGAEVTPRNTVLV